MTPRDYVDYLHDILEAIRKARRFVDNVEFDDFVLNDEKIYAVMQALEIIGEASKKIPPTIRKRYSQIPWREVAGMRDKLAHDYFEVDVRRLWQTVQDDLAPLQDAVEQILAEAESNPQSH
jgi:uncharacterized protein with HEPN domain